jgi:pimeloyl-ACP methyl ester carboxylesterase
MPTLQLDDTILHYALEGNGPPLILLAGFASDSASWTPMIPLLRDQFQLIMPDNRGTGRTQTLGPITIEAMAADAIALADHLGVHCASIVGHSMGVSIALTLAHARPALASKLVLAAAAPPVPVHAQATIEALVALHARLGNDPLWFRALFSWLFAPAFFADARRVEGAAVLAANYPHNPTHAALTAQAAAVAAWRLPQPLPQHPALLLAGAHDLLIPQGAIEAFARTLPDAQLEVLAHAAHSLFWDAPEQTAALIARFAQAR